VNPGALQDREHNARRHGARQLKLLASSIQAFGFLVPVLVAGTTIVAGHARVAAAKRLGLAQVPTIDVSHLTQDQVRAFAIADNRLCERGEWDRELLRLEMEALLSVDLDFSLEVTGFEVAEIDLIIAGGEAPAIDDDAAVEPAAGPAVSRAGDLWVTPDRRLSLLCGDALQAASYERLLDGELADLVVSDVPYNVRIQNFAGGKGRVRRREFAMASGEMSPDQFTDFLTTASSLFARFSREGSLHYLWIDWRHLEEMMRAGKASYDDFVALCVWRKTQGAMGSLYRNAHELVFVFKKGDAPHVNNVQLGKFGRNRTNVWTHAGANTFRRGRAADLDAHPTVKPLQMIADAILDASHPNHLVLDGFVGSGTTLLAAHKVGRRGAGIEIDPLYVDTAIRRIQAAARVRFQHSETGERFDDRAGALV